jgi:hypothetical protein
MHLGFHARDTTEVASPLRLTGKKVPVMAGHDGMDGARRSFIRTRIGRGPVGTRNDILGS